MRIGIFTDFYLPHIGGTETSIFHQHRALTAAGHRVFVISPPMKGADDISDQVEDTIRLRSPIQLYFEKAGVFIYSPGASKKLDRLKLDIVHVQTEYKLGCFGARYAKTRGLPLVYTAHTFTPPQIEQYMKTPRSAANLAWLMQLVTLGKYRPDTKYRGDDGYLGIPCHTYAQNKILEVWMRFASIADVIIAPSERMKAYIEHYLPGKDVQRIPNPFSSLITDTNLPAKPSHTPIRFMSTSAMRPEKKLDVLVAAVALLNHAEREMMSLDMYGGGMEFKKIQRMVKEHNLQDVIRLHGSVDNRIVQRALLDNDVVISMSVGFDNQPMIFLEALHAGNAILYCDKYLTEGTHGENAVLSEASPEVFAESLRRLIHDPEGVTRLKQNSKQLSYQYTSKAFVDKYEAALSVLA